MIKFFKPILEKNKITYPIMFKDEFVNITNEYISSEDLEIIDNVEGIIATYVSLAICNNLPIVSETAIDKLFYKNLMKLPNLYYKHNTELLKLNGGKYSLKIDAPIIKKSKKKVKNKCATAMSGGIDSIYTLIKNNTTITHLFYVIGFDIKETETNKKWIAQVLDIVKMITNKFNKKLIICRSNLLCHIKTLPGKNYFGSYWANYMVGGGICSIIYPLNFNKLLISGNGDGMPNESYTDHIWGLLFDNLFSSNIMKVIHYDIVPRWEKLFIIAKTNCWILPSIRFCIKNNSTNGLNCGKCEKCLWTYIMMYLLGLSNCVEIKGINDNNYLEIIDKFEKIHDPCYSFQIKHLLKYFDHDNKKTQLK